MMCCTLIYFLITDTTIKLTKNHLISYFCMSITAAHYYVSCEKCDLLHIKFSSFCFFLLFVINALTFISIAACCHGSTK